MHFTKMMACAAVISAASPAMAEDLRPGGKLMLTNGVTSIEGSSGGGISTWALIAGNETSDGIGGSVHVSVVALPDYDWQSHGAALGLFDKVELSYARQNFNTRDIGAALGIGQDYMLRQDVFGAKVRVFGDAVYGSPWAPQVAVGVQHKRTLDGWVAKAVGAKETDGTDFYVAASKLSLSTSILLGATARLTKANQNGLLGFGGDRSNDYSVQFEGTLGYQLSRRFVVGGEYRTKPDNLGVAREDDWVDLYAAYAITGNLTATAAYVDLGSIATVPKQRGAFFSLQASF